MKERLTQDLPDHENEADDRDNIQPLPCNFPLSLTVLLGMAVVMTMIYSTRAVLLNALVTRGHTGQLIHEKKKEKRNTI